MRFAWAEVPSVACEGGRIMGGPRWRVSGGCALVGLMCVLALASQAGARADTVGLALSRVSGPPTAQVLVSGSGFAAAEQVTLSFDLAPLVVTSADLTGGFSQRIAIPVSALPGQHQLAAVGATSGLFVDRSFTVRTDWRGFLRTSSHSGENPFENVLSPITVGGLTQAWAALTGWEVLGSSAAVVQDRVFIGALDGRVYSFDAATGALRWSTPTGGGVLSSPAVAAGVLYVGSDDGHLYALDAATGAVLWTHDAS